MAPAVPFALVGVVQLTAVAVWLGLAGAVSFPRLRRPGTPLLIIGAVAMALAEALTALRLSSAESDPLAWLRLGALALLAVGFLVTSLQPRPTALPAIVVPLGATPSLAVAGGVAGVAAAIAVAVRNLATAGRRVALSLAVGLVLTGVATALAGSARHSRDAALALLAARAAASTAFAVALVDIARDNLLGKLLGAIVAGVVAMAVGAVAVVGIGVANEVQHDQSQRLLSVATAQQRALQSLATRAGVYAHVVALCPASRARCIAALKLFSVDPDYFAVIATGSGVRTIAPSSKVLDPTALIQVAGSPIVRDALKKSTTSRIVPSGPLLLHGSPQRLAVVAAVPGRPGGVNDAQVTPSFAAVYGIVLSRRYLDSLAGQAGYDVSVLAGNQLLASSLGPSGSRQVVAEARADGVAAAGPTTTSVVPAQGRSPTVAFVPVTRPGNDNVRIATLAISQPASAALAAQRSVLRRLVLTALAVLLVISIAAFLLAQQVVEPVRRLTRAADRVRRGDLDTTVAVDSHDEVGSLAQAFDEMTVSLRGLTGELRDAAVAEAALRGRLETVVSSMTDGLVTTDGRGLVTAANPMALQLLGCTEPEVLGRPLADALDLRGPDGDPVFADTLPGGGIGATSAPDAVLRRSDGSQLPVRASVATLLDQPGQVVVLSDRTREREIERMKTEFLSNVSHELRTPLTPIRGYAEMLARRPDLPRRRVQSFVAEILAGTARMHRAVELLVDVAALEAGRVGLVNQRVSVTRFAEECVADWRVHYRDRSGDIRRRVAAKLPAVDVDPMWLRKALDELVDNAVKYTAPGTAITLVASATAAGQIRIAVRDEGEGIDTARLGELLGDFSQADASETRRVGGMGLGLGFVSRVAAQLGLGMHVRSEPGAGAEFALDLPPAAVGDDRPARRTTAKRASPPRASSQGQTRAPARKPRPGAKRR